MGSTNRMQLATVRESTLGVTPGTPRMRTARLTGESLAYQPIYVDPDEIRADRMLDDPILTMIESGGGINYELSYPDDNSPLSDIIRSAMHNTWVNTPTFDNDGTADSAITDAGTTTDTYAVASGGAAVKLGHLVRATGFTNSANNQIFRAASSSGTTVVGSSLSLSAETAPPGTAKLKVVGFQGASGDLTALSDGIGSTDLDFTTLGLAVGQWLKIGGTATGDKFATAACNGWARVSGTITATKIPLDNLPTGWTTDAGTSKTVKVWFGDQIKNGVTQTSMTIERGFLDQSVPTYIVNVGMVVDTMSVSMASRAKITGAIAFKGMGGSVGTTALDASPDAVTTGLVMAGNANVGRVGVDGSALVSPNWARSFEVTISNNLRVLEAVDSSSPVGINPGECMVAGKISTYFGSLGELNKFYNNTATAINSRVAKNSQALIYQIPRATYRGGGNPQAGGKNADVMADFDFQASKDTLTSAHIIIDRIPYFEA